MEVTEQDFSSDFLERFGEKEKQYILDFCNTFLKTFPNVLDKEELISRLSRIRKLEAKEEIRAREITGETVYNDMSISYLPNQSERDERNSIYHELFHVLSYRRNIRNMFYQRGLYDDEIKFENETSDNWYSESEAFDEIMNEYYTVKMLECEGRFFEGEYEVEARNKVDSSRVITKYYGNGYVINVHLAEIYDMSFGTDLLKAKLLDREEFVDKFNERFKHINMPTKSAIDAPYMSQFARIGKQLSENKSQANITAIEIWKECYKDKIKDGKLDLFDYLSESKRVQNALPQLDSYYNSFRGDINIETQKELAELLKKADEEFVVQYLRPDLVGEQTEPDKILQKKQFLAVINTLRDNIENLTREHIEAVTYGELSQYTHLNLSCVVINAGTKAFMTFAAEDEYRGSSEFKELSENIAQDTLVDGRNVQYATVPTPRCKWSIIKDENGYIPVQDNPNKEYAQLTGEVDLTGKAINRTKESAIPRKGQTMNITYDQVKQKQKKENSKKRADGERIKMSGLKSDISNSKIRDGEVVQSQEEIKEINNRRSLLFRASLRPLSPEEQEKLDMLNAKYGETENTQTQSKGQRKGNGRGR